MKKYLFGLFAVALAIGFSSFKVDKTPFAKVVYYQLTTFADADVQDNANWTTTSKTCPSGSDKACEFTVPDNQVTSGGVLQNTTISTGSNITDVYFVSSATNATSIVNKD